MLIPKQRQKMQKKETTFTFGWMDLYLIILPNESRECRRWHLPKFTINYLKNDKPLNDESTAGTLYTNVEKNSKWN